jgi:PAS domain S-box-containing protein
MLLIDVVGDFLVPEPYADDIAAVRRLDAVPTILDTVCQVTGMGFAAIARVSDDRWIACSVRDDINFGLTPGGELKLETTICHEIRQSGLEVIISDVATDPIYCHHHTPAQYGFRSYISVPIVLGDGRFFGTLCAIDPHPRDLSRPEIQGMFRMFAKLVGLQLYQADQLTAEITASAALRESEVRHRQILDSATDYAIIATNIDGRVTRWNEGAHMILGWSEEEMLGETAERFFTPEDRADNRVELEMEAARATGRGNDERWHLKKDGGRFWASGAMMLLRTESGAHYGYIKVLRDRTEERLTTETLRDSQSNIKLLLDSMVEGFYAVDRDGVTTVCNQAFLRMMGIEREEDAVGIKLHDLIHHTHPDGGRYDVADCPIYTCARTGHPAHVHEELFFPIDGRPPLPVEYWAIPIMQDGELQGAICTFLDITDRIVAVRERQSSDERYRSLFNSLDVGFCIIEMAFDANGQAADYRFVEVNQAFVRQTGLDDAAGNWMRTLRPGHEQHWFDIYGRVAATGESARFEDAAESLDRRWYDVHAFRIGAPGEHLVAILFSDISDRRKAELALRELNRTLDARVSEAISERETAMDALRQSQKVEAIGQLTGGVAHDFNNLLTVIRGSVDLLRRPDLADERRKRYLDAIADTSDRAVRLTSQLLAFARRSALKPETFDVGISLQALRDMLGTLSGSNIQIDIIVSPDACYARADPSQFDTAIVNMAVNARDAMQRQGTLVISVAPATAIPARRNHPYTAGDYVAVAITDTGSGIAAGRIDHIFEPFFTTKGVGEGTGLGLSQVFGFAKQSGGEVVVDSVVGEGTTFTLFLPRVVAAAESGDDDLPESVALAKGARILVVEDNAEVGAFATQALTELGQSTDLAIDGPQALAKLSEGGASYDAVFSDVAMPGMTGIELGQTIRRLYPRLPVLLTSGYSAVIAQEGTHGFDLLQKPYSVDELASALKRVMGPGRRQRR